MSNKVFMLLLALTVCLTCQADVWLGKEKKEILDNLVGKGESTEIVADNEKELKIKCIIEDERCRRFDVEYSFKLTKGICTYYSEMMPVHNYWAGVYKDFINQQEGQGKGKELDVDGEILLTEYIFDGYTLNFKIEDERLVATFNTDSSLVSR